MTLDTFLAIASCVMAAICYIGHRYFSENVWLKC